MDVSAIMSPNPHPIGVAPFFKGTHFDQAGHVTGELRLRGETIPIDCFSVCDRSWGPRPAGRRRRAAATTRRSAREPVVSATASGPQGRAMRGSSTRFPQIDTDPVVCGFVFRDGEYTHILTGERRVDFDADTGWPTRWRSAPPTTRVASSRL